MVAKELKKFFLLGGGSMGSMLVIGHLLRPLQNRAPLAWGRKKRKLLGLRLKPDPQYKGTVFFAWKWITGTHGQMGFKTGL